jgi:hypothetical protein
MNECGRDKKVVLVGQPIPSTSNPWKLIFLLEVFGDGADADCSAENPIKSIHVYLTPPKHPHY